MKKNYFSLIIILVFGLFYQQASAQAPQANDDFVSVENGSQTTVVLQDVLGNDVIGNLPATLSNVTIESISSPSGYFELLPNGSVVFSGGPAEPGTYTLEYMICSLQQTGCDVATVFLTVGCVPLPPPVVVNVIQPTCLSSNGSITIGGIPAGAAVQYSINGGANQTIASQGFNITIAVNGLVGPQYYLIQTVNGQCSSPPITIPINGTSGIGFSMSGNYVDYNSDGHTNVGDIISYQFTVTNNGCTNMTNIQAQSTILNVLGGPLASLTSGASDNTTFTATYALTQTDINNGYVSKSASVSGLLEGGGNVGNQTSATVTLNISDGIRMFAFIDSNNNGTKDTNEPYFNSGTFNYEVNNSGTVHHINSYIQPFYLFESNPATTYDLSFTVNPGYTNYYTTSNVYNDITVANNSGIISYYFALTEIPYTDLAVNVYGYGAPPRPGFTYSNYITVRNLGNQPIANATVTFTKSNLVTITNISQTGTTPTANGFTYSYSNLLPGAYQTIIVTMQVPTIPTIALGNVVTNAASITVPAGDIDITNNSNELSQIIVGSYDPNDKTENHGGKVLHSTFTANDYLTYTIRFENTGTANAVNVSVVDVLDSKLDETSVKMVNASHAYVLDRVGSTLTWKFDGIELPPSVEDTMIGHGYITFQVKPKAGYALGDVIPNIASIYFDFNPAIVTEPCVTQFVSSLSTEKFAFENFRCYPNPVKNVVTVSNDTAIDKVVITSILGQTVSEKMVNSLKTEIDLSGLASGVYFVKASSQKQSKTVKIIKQ